jgi:aspartyl/asparaginyl-tRNA synthetase
MNDACACTCVSSVFLTNVYRFYSLAHSLISTVTTYAYSHTQVQTPLITSSDCEGAGEMFRVTTLPIDKPLSMPTLPSAPPTFSPKKVTVTGTGTEAGTDADADADIRTDFTKDFFHKPAYLTVSGQMNGEAYAQVRIRIRSLQEQ